MSASRTSGGLALGVVGVVALDGRWRAGSAAPQRRASTPPTRRVVHAQLEALAVEALLGRAGLAVDLAPGSPGRRGSARACRCRAAAPSTSSSSRSSYSISRARRSAARCVATAWRRKRSGIRSQPGVRSKKSKMAVREASASTPAGREDLDRLRDARDLALLGRAAPVGDPQHGDHERDVGLDGRDHLAHRARAPRAPRAERGCATRRAPGMPRVPRTRPSDGVRDPRSVRRAVAGCCRAWFMAASKSELVSRLSRTVRGPVRTANRHGWTKG